MGARVFEHEDLVVGREVEAVSVDDELGRRVQDDASTVLASTSLRGWPMVSHFSLPGRKKAESEGQMGGGHLQSEQRKRSDETGQVELMAARTTSSSGLGAVRVKTSY